MPDHFHMLAKTAIQPVNVITPSFQRLVVVFVLTAVQGLLANKAANLDLELGIINPVPVQPHRIDKLLFAIRKL